MPIEAEVEKRARELADVMHALRQSHAELRAGLVSQLQAIDAELARADDAEQRLAAFRPKLGNYVICPYCWMYDKVEHPLLALERLPTTSFIRASASSAVRPATIATQARPSTRLSFERGRLTNPGRPRAVGYCRATRASVVVARSRAVWSYDTRQSCLIPNSSIADRPPELMMRPVGSPRRAIEQTLEGQEGALRIVFILGRERPHSIPIRRHGRPLKAEGRPERDGIVAHLSLGSAHVQRNAKLAPPSKPGQYPPRRRATGRRG